MVGVNFSLQLSVGDFFFWWLRLFPPDPSLQALNDCFFTGHQSDALSLTVCTVFIKHLVVEFIGGNNLFVIRFIFVFF